MKNLTLTVVLLMLSACASNQFGDQTESISIDQTVIYDTVAVIESIHAPAKTSFSLAHEIDEKDSYGNRLVAEMRKKGYAIQSYAKDQDTIGMPFSYALTQFDAVVSVRITMGQKSLSRAYEVSQTGSIKPHGNWALME